MSLWMMSPGVNRRLKRPWFSGHHPRCLREIEVRMEEAFISLIRQTDWKGRSETCPCNARRCSMSAELFTTQVQEAPIRGAKPDQTFR